MGQQKAEQSQNKKRTTVKNEKQIPYSRKPNGTNKGPVQNFFGDSMKSNKSEGTRKGLSHMANSDPEINNER